jgi:hypothetical protein
MPAALGYGEEGQGGRVGGGEALRFENTPFLSHLYIKNDLFTKTGSGQT